MKSTACLYTVTPLNTYKHPLQAKSKCQAEVHQQYQIFSLNQEKTNTHQHRANKKT
jgi:hypothetical protein